MRFRVTISCPKCASREGKSIEEMYIERTTPDHEHAPLPAELARQASPPIRRHPFWWLAASVTFFVLASITLEAPGSVTVALATCGALSAWMERDANRYNELYLPRLTEYWHRAFICERCGEIFVPG